MPVEDGKFIQPTDKAFKIPIAIFVILENGALTEEHLFCKANWLAINKSTEDYLLAYFKFFTYFSENSFQ
jgi:hypothetical protein